MYKIKTDKNPSMERGCGHEVPSLAEELLVIASCWERKSFLVPDT
jgi:hypothetical protein